MYEYLHQIYKKYHYVHVSCMSKLYGSKTLVNIFHQQFFLIIKIFTKYNFDKYRLRTPNH